MGNKSTSGILEFIFQPVKISSHKLLFIMEMPWAAFRGGQEHGSEMALVNGEHFVKSPCEV